MDDEEDVKKMIELIKLNQEDNTQDFQYDDFINFENSDVEEDEENLVNFDDYDFCNSSNTDISKLNTYDPRSTLKPDERFTIDSCGDLELKNLLLLNRTKNFQLMQLYKKLKDLLIQCQKDINERTELIANFVKENKEQAHSSGAWRLAAPYFKDKQLYACPPNADTLRKKRNKELNVYSITFTMKWSSLECQKLLRAVKLNYNINQQTDILKKITNIQQKKNTHDNDELADLEHRMRILQNDDNTEVPPLNSDKYIDWMRVAEIFLQDRRTSFECKSFWHIYLHPDINKSPWTPAENKKLKSLVQKYKFQNWDKIAEELGNNRTGFTACMNFYGNVHERFRKGDFTVEEDCALIRLVHKHKMGDYIPWVKIVQHLKSRTRSQLHHRYTYFLSQNDKRKGKFTDAEDILLMILVDKFGKNFRKCAEYLPTRSMVQLKSRYTTNLQQKLKKGSFTLQEDQIIMKFVAEHGERSWSKLVNTLHRCNSQLRQRYNVIQDYLGKSPESTLANVPRRKHNMTEEEDSFNFLRTVADQLLELPNIPTLQDIEKIIQNHHEKEELEVVGSLPNVKRNINVPGRPLGIDDMLTNFFSNSFKLDPNKCVCSKYVKKAAKDVQTILDTFNVKLDIPENFDEEKRLDNLDVAILNMLSEKAVEKRKVENDICVSLPPNLFGLVGLRSLLIKYSSDMSDLHMSREKRNRLTSENKSNIMKQLLYMSEETRQQIKHDHDLFYKRFQAAFKWPAIMTLVNPSRELWTTPSSDLTLNKMQIRRTYSRADRNKSNECADKQKTAPEMPSSSAEMTPLRLTPVTNKSVIQDLLLNKTKKLFCMRTVKCGDDTKTVIEEVDFRSRAALKETATNNVDNTDVKASRVRLKEATVSASGTDLDEPSEKKQKLSQFVPEHGECIILDTGEDDYMSIGDEVGEKSDDEGNDEEDLKRLETFLLKQQSEDVPKEDEDQEDLRKLENFLKDQEVDYKFII